MYLHIVWLRVFWDSVFLETWAASKPVISLQQGNTVVVDAGRDGLVDYQNEQMLAETVITTKTQMGKNFGKKADPEVLSHYTWPKLLQF